MAGIKEVAKRWLLPPGVTDVLAKILFSEKQEAKTLSGVERSLLQKNELLKDIHLNDRCFVLGAGPSVKQQDISKVAGEFVISVSNTFVHPDYIKIGPQYHVLPPIIASHGNLQSIERYVDWLKEMEKATDKAEMFFHIGDRPMVEDHGLFKGRTIHWIDYQPSWREDFKEQIDLRDLPPVRSVSETAISIAIYLGFREIYLLGIDHDWFNGLFNHFYEYRKEDIERWASKLSQVDSEFQMRRHAKIFKKYKYFYSIKQNIYNANANKNSYVDVFPKVDFDSLFTSGS